MPRHRPVREAFSARLVDYPHDPAVRSDQHEVPGAYVQPQVHVWLGADVVRLRMKAQFLVHPPFEHRVGRRVERGLALPDAHTPPQVVVARGQRPVPARGADLRIRQFAHAAIVAGLADPAVTLPPRTRLFTSPSPWCSASASAKRDTARVRQAGAASTKTV